MFTVWIFNTIIFYMSFLLSKNGLCMRISAYPLAENDFFLNVPQLLWVFWGHVPNSLRNKNMERHIPYLLQKCFFWPSKLCCPFRTQGKKKNLSTLNIMILQTVRNECVRFGRHVDIEVSYKILQLDVLKETQILHNLSCFK
jgi:hypothetical protein